MPLFAFSQVEVPWPLGPPDGRYLVRAGEAHPQAPPTHVLLFATLGARQRHRIGRRRRPAPPQPEPSAVPIGRATVIAAAPFSDAAAAARWLAAAGEAELAAHLLVLERALHAFRVVTADPYGEPLARERLLVARIGFGEGEQVAGGRWTEARELLPAAELSRRRSRLLEPQSRLAGVLGGHVPLLVCEELTLRAHRDLDAGRERAAALQLRIALDAALAELATDGRLAARLRELGEAQPGLGRAADAALTRGLTESERDALRAGLARLEAALRARAASLP